ncbi:NADH dehydrogenase [ubiquinone] 1 beta subcomplex subunit 6 isoform X1 [Scyliorhinus torazame]|uniref:NADH dehydrogenase [ubiquinone] 1 beta subcomplex subunit 6 isoform X1 n=1 Tax=Scyliorhinus torazame TaxID=75743 RepID=UPI003B599E24
MPLGYTPEEKARVQQLVKLRRQWLKDQELSPREPLLSADSKGPVSRFWEGFLQPRSLWRVWTYKTCNAGWWTLTRLLVPAWFVHYYVKYHVETKSYGIVSVKPKIFPGDTVLETGEVIPPMEEAEQIGHH